MRLRKDEFVQLLVLYFCTIIFAKDTHEVTRDSLKVVASIHHPTILVYVAHLSLCAPIYYNMHVFASYTACCPYYSFVCENVGNDMSLYTSERGDVKRENSRSPL